MFICLLGTSEEEIVHIFEEAGSILRDFSGGKKMQFSFRSTVFVFLDEVNTCAHMGLM